MKKLSELNGVEMADVLCEIIEPMGRLMDDEKVVDCFGKLAEIIKSNPSQMLFLAKCMREVTPVFLGTEHRDDTFMIIAALNGVTVDEVKAKPGVDLIMDVFWMVAGDGGLLRMFRPRKAVRSEAAAGNPV